jgi:hypothetical protein
VGDGGGVSEGSPEAGATEAESQVGDGGEEFVEAFPEVLPGAIDWVYSNKPDDGNITVTREGLRKLLIMSKHVWTLALAAFLQSIGKTDDAKDMYPETFDSAWLAKRMNESSSVFCEGKLIVSGLFTDKDGKPVINECAEDQTVVGVGMGAGAGATNTESTPGAPAN